MKPRNNNADHRLEARRAFTLIELLVASAIAVMLMALVLTVIGRTSAIWQDVFARTSSRQNARTALDFMARELEGVRLPLYRARTTNTNELGLQFLLTPSTISADFRNPHAIFFQAPVSASNPDGDIGIVGYFVYWDVTDPAHPKPQLRRLAVGADSPDFKVYSDPGTWLNDALVNNLAVPETGAPLRGWFVDGVLALFVRAIDMEGNPIAYYSSPATLLATATQVGPTYEYDSRRGYRIPLPTPVRTILPPVLPRSLEVALVVVSPRAVGRITATLVPASGLFVDPANFWTDIRAFINGLPANLKSDVRVYSTRIQLPSPT